jgi:hypothetical protein
MEAKYMVALFDTKETIYLKKLLHELAFTPWVTIKILTKNQGNVTHMRNPIHHKSTKHIDIQRHYVREMVIANEVAFEYYLC